MIKDIFSENYSNAAKAIQKAIEHDVKSEKKEKAREGLKYYSRRHDILDFKLYYFNSEGVMVEEKNRSNIKIPHGYHTELVDQKVNYLASNPIQIKVEDETYQKELEAYFGESFQSLIRDALESAANKGLEYIYTYRKADGKMGFAVADSLGVILVKDEQDMGKELGILRYYTTTIQDKEGKDIEIIKAEVWTDKNTTYFTQEKGKNTYVLDDTAKPNPRPHITLEDDKAYYDGGGLGYIPFFKLQNNKEESTDLEPIKALIDDYDLMACSLSNNLQDFQEAIYVVRGYAGDDLDALTNNLKTRKTIGVDSEGGLEVKTVDIPTEARKVKLELDKEGIYKFGMGFDSSQVGDSNITNVVIKSRYSLLDLKCNKVEPKLRMVLRDLIKVMTDEINTRLSTKYLYQDPQIIITREMMVNEDNIVTNEKAKAETTNQKIETVILSPISEESKLKLVCEILELDFEEEKAKLEAEGPYEVDKNLVSTMMGGDPIGEES